MTIENKSPANAIGRRFCFIAYGFQAYPVVPIIAFTVVLP